MLIIHNQISCFNFTLNNTKFTCVSACWKQAQVSAEIVRSLRNEYISEKDKTQSPILLNPDTPNN